MDMVKEISSTELKDLIDNKKAKVIDCRESFERDQSYIPGTEFIPMNQIPAHLEKLKNEDLVIFTCRTGNRSYHVCQWLEQQGLMNTANHTGGIFDWMGNGLEVSE